MAPDYNLIMLIAGRCPAAAGLGLGTLLGPAHFRRRASARPSANWISCCRTSGPTKTRSWNTLPTLPNSSTSLTGRYRDGQAHNHLARGADQLCSGRGPVALGQLDNDDDDSEIPAQLADIRRTLDYAPRTSPDGKGHAGRGIRHRASRPRSPR